MKILTRRLGGESASQHPPGTRKSFWFGRACLRAVSVMSVGAEKVPRGIVPFIFFPRGCLFYLLEVLYLWRWSGCECQIEVSSEVNSKCIRKFNRSDLWNRRWSRKCNRSEHECEVEVKSKVITKRIRKLSRSEYASEIWDGNRSDCESDIEVNSKVNSK